MDLSLYGTLVPFLASACPTAMDWMDECDLRPWVDRMNARIPLCRLRNGLLHGVLPG